LRRGLLEMAYELYDHEFGCLLRLGQRIYECIVNVDAYIRWMDEQGKASVMLERPLKQKTETRIRERESNGFIG
jgi:hypothetical protein